MSPKEIVNEMMRLDAFSQWLGISIDVIFGDLILTLFSNFFNSEALFRVWDLLFLYSSGA